MRNAILRNFPIGWLLLFLVFHGISLSGQNKELNYNENLLDFWVGEWELSWVSNDTIENSATNSIEKILSDQVIYENFSIETGPQKGYTGKSWSVYNQRTKEWRQTWVDNQGAYLEFTGHLKGDSVIFQREMSLKNGRTRQQRMVFHNIRNDSFIWSWQHRDEQQTGAFGPWKSDWVINYKRKEK